MDAAATGLPCRRADRVPAVRRFCGRAGKGAAGLIDALGFPTGRAVALDDRVRVWNDASAVLGGAPWGVSRIAPAGRDFVRRLADSGARGVVPSPGVEAALTDLLLKRGIVHPVAATRVMVVDVVVPAYERPDLLRDCLESLRAASPGARVIVVDDASTDPGVAAAARSAGAALVLHAVNRGPAAARNTGLREAASPIVAFVDSDCTVTGGWLDTLVAHFDDPRVAAVAPRIVPRSPSSGLLARFQTTRSALDMGPRPELVTFGAPLGFLPSAALLVRRSAVGDSAFDEDLRLGEDVDLIWRLSEAGRLVRYEPAAVVTHEIRPTSGWARRIFDYGTSAAPLDRRHPGRLAPARFSGWNLAIAVILLARKPSAGVRASTALGIAGTATALLARRLRGSGVDAGVAPVVIGRTLASDAQAAGHLLRREWWPLGWIALGSGVRSRAGAAATAAMLIPLVLQWRSRRPDVDLPRYLGLRLIKDAAYGAGVIVGAVRARQAGVLLPLVRLPYLPGRNRR